VILVDSNLPMYLVGAHDGWKARARRALDRAVSAGERLVTDAEVFQEILHHYVPSIGATPFSPRSMRCSSSSTKSCRSTRRRSNERNL